MTVTITTTNYIIYTNTTPQPLLLHRLRCSRRQCRTHPLHRVPAGAQSEDLPQRPGHRGGSAEHAVYDEVGRDSAYIVCGVVVYNM